MKMSDTKSKSMKMKSKDTDVAGVRKGSSTEKSSVKKTMKMKSACMCGK